MPIIKKYFLLLFYIFIITGRSQGQQIIYHEGFDNQKIYYDNLPSNIPGNVSSSDRASGIVDLSSSMGRKNGYTTPLLHVSRGVCFLTFTYKQEILPSNAGGLKVYYKTEVGASWSLLAFFTNSTSDWTSTTLYLPADSADCWILFTASGIGVNTLFLDNIEVYKYPNASAFALNNKVYVDRENNFSAFFLEVEVSEFQLAGLPVIDSTNTMQRTPGIPVGCPGNITMMENEPVCYNEYMDTINGGCNGLVVQNFTELSACNGVICGKSGFYNYEGVPNRDLDCYRLVLNAGANISMKVVADFKVRIFIISLPYYCNYDQYIGPGTTSVAGDTASLTYTSLVPINVVFWIAPSTGQTVPCGSNYVLIYKTDPNTPDTPIAANNPACNSTQLNPLISPSYNYYWQGTTCETNMTYPASVPFQITSSGTYYVRGKRVSLGCWSPCTSVSVSVNTLLPTISATAIPSTVCPGQSSTLTGTGNSTSYTWQPGNLTGSQVDVIPAITTIYTVTGDLNGCTSTSTITVNTDPCTGIDAADELGTITVGPVPFKDELFIDCKTSQDIEIALYSIEGKLLLAEDFEGESSYRISTVDLPQAVYFLKIQTEKASKVIKILKQ